MLSTVVCGNYFAESDTILVSKSSMEYSKKEGGVGESLSLYKGGRNCAPPHLLVKIAFFPSAMIDGTVGLPTPVLMRIP